MEVLTGKLPSGCLEDIWHCLQLASFMSELESSGLLDKEPLHPAAPTAPTEGPNPSTTPGPHTSVGSSSPGSVAEQPNHNTAEPEANLAATIVSAVTDDQGEMVGQEEAGQVPEQHTAEVSGVGVAASSEPAEQRVLGDLEGALTWREVRFGLHTHTSCCLGCYDCMGMIVHAVCTCSKAWRCLVLQVSMKIFMLSDTLC